jgi:hypothetical protein
MTPDGSEWLRTEPRTISSLLTDKGEDRDIKLPHDAASVVPNPPR